MSQVDALTPAAKDVNDILRQQLDIDAGKLAETQARVRELEQLTYDHAVQHKALASVQADLQRQNTQLHEQLADANKREVEQLVAFSSAEAEHTARYATVEGALAEVEQRCSDLVTTKGGLECRCAVQPPLAMHESGTDTVLLQGRHPSDRC